MDRRQISLHAARRPLCAGTLTAALLLALGACAAAPSDRSSTAGRGVVPTVSADAATETGAVGAFLQLADAKGGSRAFGHPTATSPYGDYLAGLVAKRQRDYGNAADFMQKALRFDPKNRELLIDTFMLVTGEGHRDQAVALAQRMESLDLQHPTAGLVLAVDAALSDDMAEAERRLAALPPRGLSGLIAPLMRAWIAVETGDGPRALELLGPFGERPGFGTLYEFHRALMLDVLGDPAAGEAYDAAIATSEQPSFRLTWMAGNHFERAGRRGRANELYRGYLQRSPDSLLLSAAMARLAEARTPAPIVDGALAGMAAGLFDLASLLTQERADELAMVHARIALWLAPDMTLDRVLVGEILQRQGRHAAAIEVYRGIPVSSPFWWAVRLRIAEELVELDRKEEAVAELRSLADAYPERFEPLYRLGNLLRGEERFVEAAAAYDEAVERLGEPREQHWSLYYFRGIALERSKQWPRAEADFIKALELRPEQPYVMNYLAYSWVEQQQNLQQAETMLVRAVELQPDDGYIVDSLGWVYYRLERYEEAVELLERAVELRPQDPVINDHLGDAYWRTGRLREARVQWQRALSLEPTEDQVPLIEEKIERGLGAKSEDI